MKASNTMKTVITNRPIGIRVLSPEMLSCTFRHVDSVLAAIERCRSAAEREAREHFDERLRKSPHETLMSSRGFNNAISILGSRGSGKTSIIMTLEYILRHGRDYWTGEAREPKDDLRLRNVIMPILVPQDFVRGQLLLSWVITQLVSKAEEIEREISQNDGAALGRCGAFRAWVSEGDGRLYQDPLRECMDSLKASFELRYKSGAGVRDEAYVFRYMEEVRKDSNLAVDVLRLISMICDYYRFASRDRGCAEGDGSFEPLLFFAIDDLDLAPERSQEVLNLVLRYLQHPNVVVLCGWNQELFQSHLTMEVLQRQQMLDSGSIRVNGDYTDVFMSRLRKRVDLLDSARRLSVDNLKKAFPPALRYEVRGLKTDQRAKFPRLDLVECGVADGRGDGEDGSLIGLIEQTLLAARPRDGRDVTVEFMRNGRGEFLLVYMRIFDNKARGLMNVYHAFQAMRERLEGRSSDEPLDLTADLQSLVDTILFSNTHFVPYRRGIRDLIRIDSIVVPAQGARDEAVCSYFCDYQRIYPVLSEFRSMEATVGDASADVDIYNLESEYNYFPSVVIDAYVLLNFMQNVFHYVCGLERYEHGGLDFSDALNDVNSPVAIDGAREDLLSYALLSAGIREVRLFPTTADFRTNLCLLDAYERNRFVDRQYHLNGAYSYGRLSRAISAFVGTGATMPVEGSADAVPRISVDLLRQARAECPEWTGGMERVFSALRFSEENTSRLSRYRCLRKQRAYGDDDELAAASRDDTPATDFEGAKAICARHSGKPVTVTEEDNDLLVQCIRRLDILKGHASSARQAILDERGAAEKRINVAGRRPVSDDGHLARMIAFESEFGEYARKKPGKRSRKKHGSDKKGRPSWIPVGDYSAGLKRVLGLNEQVVDVANEDREDALGKAVQCLTANYDVLLDELRDRLLLSFATQYESMDTPERRFEYLLAASEALAKYRERWGIGEGVWTAAEEEAADELMGILGAYAGMSDGYQYARELRELGPGLGHAVGRSYRRRIAHLESWIESNENLFDTQHLSRLYASLGTLRRAGYKSRRRTQADDDIDKVLMGIGKTIAALSASVSFCEELTRNRSSSERSMVSWPIIEESRHVFDNWAEVGPVRVGREVGNRTLFDL